MPTTKQGTAKNTAATQAGKQAAAPKHTTAKQAGTPAAAKHTTSHGLMKAVQPSAVQDPKMKQLFFEAGFYRTRCLYLWGTRDPNVKDRKKVVEAMTTHLNRESS